VNGQTVHRPGGADAAIVKIEDHARALAMTTDCTPRYVVADPEEGGKQAVAEAWRNITATGALPLAITDNMNFGNPEKPRIMGQFASAVRGMAAACTALDFPVVSGNVSLYNETEGRAILPTPAIGGVGVIDDAASAIGLGMPAQADLVLIGTTAGHLGQSLWLREIAHREEGAPPPVDLTAERRNGDFVRSQILAGTVLACHDCADGGLLVTLAEMAMATATGATLHAPGATTAAGAGPTRHSTDTVATAGTGSTPHTIGTTTTPGTGSPPTAPSTTAASGTATTASAGSAPATVQATLPAHAFWFGEDQARYVLAVSDANAILAAAQAAGVPAIRLGRAGGTTLDLGAGRAISVSTLREANEATLPALMEGRA
jgi:phosphoribosylformylglycinamidine (FGAM) synthase-like enzyme